MLDAVEILCVDFVDLIGLSLQTEEIIPFALICQVTQQIPFFRRPRRHCRRLLPRPRLCLLAEQR